MYTPKVWQILNVFSRKKRNHHLTSVFAWFRIMAMQWPCIFPMQTSPQDPLSMKQHPCPMALLQCPWSSRLSGRGSQIFVLHLKVELKQVHIRWLVTCLWYLERNPYVRRFLQENVLRMFGFNDCHWCRPLIPWCWFDSLTWNPWTTSRDSRDVV